VHHALALRALLSFAALPHNIGQFVRQGTKVPHVCVLFVQHARVYNTRDHF